jgi:hypothetical protein
LRDKQFYPAALADALDGDIDAAIYLGDVN